jgi:hypothetical protein
MNTINLKLKREEHKRQGFHASDMGKLGFDIYHDFMGTPQTNPAAWNESLKWAAGKGVELQMVQILKDNGIVAADFDQAKEETSTMERLGVPIRMKIDAIIGKNEHDLIEGACLEIKSINNKNAFDVKKYAEGYPRDNYVGQLSVYMDYLKQDTGYLFVASIDGLNNFWFECKKTGEGKYQCGQTQVDINKEYERWAKIWKCVQEKVEPDPFEFGRYKMPLAEIDWSKVSKTDISKARNGMKVIGDPEAWRVSYSSYKDLILKAQGITEPGYTEAEIEQIKVATKGYSAKEKSDA